ncbi:hypothetical protein [Actinoplanes sp. L3-i22]|uniref:hypothetical protein n=1 Tax=Actinoplanes sp. L3-i22 TaxID=2836373 RepID=UPI001C78850E|nr:hypothetical protein [Actinoplanes sp. L3-i22]BCY14941.1 hypothetical protein L3i22_100290 [Actinoplanes sp. L3-i22]
MTTDTRIADHPYQVLVAAGTVAIGAIAVVFTPAGLVLLAAGATIAFWHRLRPSAAFAAVGAVAGAVAGPLATLGVRTEQLCCMFGWSEDRGWPSAWLSRWASADTPEQARALAIAGGWQPDPVYLATDVVLWAYAGLLVFVVINLAGRAYRAHRGPRPAPSGS